jgi:hypothetical protein
LIQAQNVPDGRLIFNVGVLGRAPANVSLPELKSIRARFPEAIINLSLSVTPYDSTVLSAAKDLARAVGGNIMFPLDARYVTRSVVTELRSVGKVAVWNNPTTWAPGNIAKATAAFRELGVAAAAE